MPPVPSSAPRRAALAGALLLPAALLVGCSSASGASCAGSAAVREDLAAQPVLSAAPAGASDPANYRGKAASSGCDDDSSGPAWVHADRVYAFTGTRQAVIEHYTRTAAAEGWQSEPGPGTEGSCWTRASHGRHLLLAVDFRLGGWTPAPDPGSGLVYEVSVGSNADGSADDAGCSD
ncbi:hypothetical protein [Streptomyces sp. NPDC090080]|uniref:hypothetical protein n=1 Tax=Streptomyces sp. NPDC090080 TaxID=3365939 RepID=UPI00380F51DE